MQEVTVRVPATVSNVVCGFDCLGFALSEPFDEMTVRKIDEPTVKITNLDDFGLPDDPRRNVAGIALLALIERAGCKNGFEIISTKHIKPGSGIGSSAASACGAVVAANKLLGSRFSDPELVELAMAGEELASGSRHADNVAPCIYGGFVLVRSTDPLDIVRLGKPRFWATVIHPQIEIRTADARALLPNNVPLRDAVKNWSNLGAFVAAINSGDTQLLARAMTDHIVEPVRSKLIPLFAEVRSASLEAGALGGGISGSGPSIFMLSETRVVAKSVEAAMISVYSRSGIDFLTYVSPISGNGVTETERR